MERVMLNNKSILITGGTGSFGRKFVGYILKNYKPKKLIVFSRDEYKQYEMARVYPKDRYGCIRYFLGDVRDKSRLMRAFEGVDYVIHAAALKQVPALEYNPIEAVKTNVIGADNIVDAAINAGVKKVIAISTDKAVNPFNLYGATKLVAEKIFQAANAYGGKKVKFSVVRYGNVIGSRGSVIPFFLSLKAKGKLEFPITDLKMTRFWITMDEAVRLVKDVIFSGEGGEIFVPRIPSMKVTDLARSIEPSCRFKIIGIRPGEKIYETLISEDESRKTVILKDKFVILPQFFDIPLLKKRYAKFSQAKPDFEYRSDTNDQWLEPADFKNIIKEARFEKVSV